jgi:membrane dipeptidase
VLYSSLQKIVISRRSLLRNAAFVLGAPLLNRGRFSLFAQGEAEYSARTLDLVRESTVIDMLGLLTLNFKKLSAWRTDPANFQPSDLKKLKDSGITIFHPAVGYTEGDVYASSLWDISAWDAFIAVHSSDFLRIDCPEDVERAKSLGKIGIVIGQQNSGHFRSIDDVNRFYKMGQRVSQLTYSHNQLGGGSIDARDPGLTKYGAEVVSRMNALGMAVDVSHCGDRTTLDAVAASRKPVLVTHSNCRALVPGSARCKTDEGIRKVTAAGGVIGVTMVRYFVSSGSSATIENVLDHIDHVARLAGVEHVGIGSDVDLQGRDSHVHLSRKNDLDGIDYERKIYDLTEGLVRRNYSNPDIQLILGGNFQRALADIWSV